MRKWIAMLTALLVTLTLAACGGSSGGPQASAEPSERPTEEPVVPEEVAYRDFSDFTLAGYANYDASEFWQNNNGPLMGDPFVFYDEENGLFYLYGTTGKSGNTHNPNWWTFQYYTSRDMQNWTHGGVCFEPTASDWGHDRLWAPEVHQVGDKYYLYYTAAADAGAALHGSVAVADSPAGPFVNAIPAGEHGPGTDGKSPRFDFGFPSIDGTLFQDEDGELYYYFAKDQVDERESDGRVRHKSTIWGVKLINPYTVAPGAEPKRLTDVGYSTVGETGPYTQPWEVAEDGKFWNEGPFMLKHDGTYYLTYSANYFGSKYYSVGCATATSPLGTFVKGANAEVMGVEPQQDKDKEWNYFSGSGHHMFLNIGSEGFIVYHRHVTANDRSKRCMVFDRYGFKDDGSLYVNGPTVSPQPLPEALSGWGNVAPRASVAADNGAANAGSLTDGAIGVYPKYAEQEFSAAEGTTTITFTFLKNVTVHAVLVYQGADPSRAFTSIGRIAFGDKYYVEDVKVSPALKDDARGYLLVGGAAAAILEKDVVTKKVTVTIKADRPVNLSEIMILGA